MFNCNCRSTETVLGIVILIVIFWPALLGAIASKWIVIVAAVLLVLHAWSCKNCGIHMSEEIPKKRRK